MPPIIIIIINALLVRERTTDQTFDKKFGFPLAKKP